ncbi:MAG TPA: PaaI family thioesterase [Ktedonobacterales bacterium]|nr:PaaI family thioesterase [Ktedonobacterales bacterium]
MSADPADRPGTLPTSQAASAGRTRTFGWHDPLAFLREVRGMSGLQMLRAIRDGELAPPPITEALDFALTEVEEGRVVFALTPAEYHYNPIGSVHGGVAATLLDSAMGCAVNTLLPAGVAYTTLELKVNYIRPLTIATGPVRAEGTVQHLGGKIAVAEGKLTGQDGKLYASATTTCLVMRP